VRSARSFDEKGWSASSAKIPVISSDKDRERIVHRSWFIVEREVHGSSELIDEL
jgi:hypothetical protein